MAECYQCAPEKFRHAAAKNTARYRAADKPNWRAIQSGIMGRTL